MREILFRGKGEDTGGKWVFGGIFIDGDNAYIFDRIALGEGLGNEVDPATVGQFTGLLDKNGVKIFEGDIIRYFVPEDVRGRYETDNFGCEGLGYSFVWDNVVGAFRVYDIAYGLYKEIIPDREDQYCNSYCDENCLSVGEISEDYVIVGNVYENSELLGGDNE